MSVNDEHTHSGNAKAEPNAAEQRQSANNPAKQPEEAGYDKKLDGPNRPSI